MQLVKDDTENQEVESNLESLTFVSEYSGLLPPPDMLAQFDNIEPGLANRIVLMTEDNLAHIRECESHNLKESLKANKRGQSFAFCLSLTALALSGYGLYLDQLAFSSVSGLFGVAPIITAFLKDFRK